MKKIVKHILVVVAVGFISNGFAQQTRQTNLFNYNTFALNPAFAGASGCTELNFSTREDWPWHEYPK